MTNVNRINLLKQGANKSKYTERILSELEFAAELSAQKEYKYEEFIGKCADFLTEALSAMANLMAGAPKKTDSSSRWRVTF